MQHAEFLMWTRFKIMLLEAFDKLQSMASFISKTALLRPRFFYSVSRPAACARLEPVSFFFPAPFYHSSNPLTLFPVPVLSGKRIPPFSLKRAMASAQAGAQHSQHQQSVQQSHERKDIIDRIRHDHAELEDYYSKYKEAAKANKEEDAKKWFNQFVWEISRHSVSEELVMYPMLESAGEKGKTLADKSRADHHKIKEMLTEMQKISDPLAMEGKMDVMMRSLREHIELEEREDLPFVHDNYSLEKREAAGTRFALGKKIAPTRPHTMVPEKPAALEAALGLLLTPMDKLKDMFTEFPDKKAL